ncbi:MAG: hypothetical protein CMJ48_02905 [Planctomycetaceae bacterium]|nr:hypothetical protein [Planctomycetaceae bacterium]
MVGADEREPNERTDGVAERVLEERGDEEGERNERDGVVEREPNERVDGAAERVLGERVDGAAERVLGERDDDEREPNERVLDERDGLADERDPNERDDEPDRDLIEEAADLMRLAIALRLSPASVLCIGTPAARISAETDRKPGQNRLESNEILMTHPPILKFGP